MRDLVVGLVALAAVTAPILANQPPASAEADGGAVTLTGEVRIEALDGAVLDIDDARTVHGSLRLDTAGRIVNDVAMEEYVAGVAEMPSRWPLEALKAQAVAARTYAWWSAEHAAHDAADICATTACQVYAGAGVVADDGDRWAEAVAATRGEVLVTDDGDPALARYFSTSGGRTYDNQEVFPATGPRPYLVGIDDPYDEVSPYHRWQVRFTREEFDEVLGAGERLAAVSPVTDVRRVGAVDDHHATIVVTGGDGVEVEVTALELRDFVSRVAPARFGERFPSRRSDGLRRLPTTLPSTRYAVEVTGDEVVFDGQGWGHGVGMGQYGARGRALEGHDHTEILAAYYRGLQPTTHDGVPERIDVHLDDVGREFTVRADAPFTITDADGEVTAAALGRWRFAHSGAGWQLTPPDGHDAELDLGPTRLLHGGDDPRTPVVVEVAVNKPAELTLQVTDADGAEVFTRRVGVVDPGEHAASWEYVDHDGDEVADGTYHLTFQARDADRVSDAEVVSVEVVRPAPDTAVPSPVPSVGTWWLVGLLSAAVAAAVVVVLRKARS